jgi:predicted RecB family nuclease
MITDQMLLLYQRCDRLAFLEAYGDRTRQDPPSDFLLKIRRESITFEDQTAQESKTVADISPRAENWLAGTKATLELMEQGFDRIYRGILSISPSGIPLVSYPTFLIKQPGSSKFGDWLYTTADVRGGKRPKQEYQIVAAFHAWLLENIQGVRPDQALLILREKGNYHVNLTLRLPQMHDILGNLITTLEEKKEPDVIISRQKCSLCQWYNSCHQIAQSRNHLCLIPGVTPNRYQHLLDLNITTINQLANSQPENFSDIPEFDNGVAEKIIKQAKSSAEKRPLANINTLQNRAKIYQLLPDSPVELYFDIEANPDFDVDYLLGVLVIDQRDHTEKYYPFFADKPEKQGIIWQQFLDLVWSYPIAPIFIFVTMKHKQFDDLPNIIKHRIIYGNLC